MVMKIVTVSGINVFRLAADELGDVTQFVRICQTNGLFDPNYTQPRAVKLPPSDPDATGGLPDA